MIVKPKFYLTRENILKLIVLSNFSVYLLVQFGLKSVFSKSAGSDAGAIERLAEEQEFGGGAYGMSAYLYSIVPDPMRDFLVYLTGLFFLYFCLRKISDIRYAICLSFLCFAPIMMAIGTFQKDLILVWFTLPLSYLVLQSASNAKSILYVVTFYAIYATLFRQYYFLILFVFIFIYFLFSAKVHYKILLLITSIVAFLLVPIDYLAILQEPRDVANLSRIFVDGRLNARTAFMNYTEVNDRIDFLLNYLFSYWMLEFSIFSYFSVREVYLILNLIFYYYFSILAVFLLPGLGRVFASLVISHILVLHLFEPDTGSYLRHISSTLPYLACIMYRVSSFSRRENEFG